MGTQLIVMVTPSRDAQSGMAQVAKPVGIQAFVAQATVEGFDDAVLHRLARLDVIEPYPSLVAPGLKPARAKLRAVIGANLPWRRPLVKDLFERRCHPASCQRGIGLNHQTLSRVGVDDCQQSQCPPLRGRVRHEV